MRACLNVILATITLLSALLTLGNLQAAEHVRLIHAYSSVGIKNGIHWQNTSLDILVRNLSYEKQVFARIDNCQGEWVDVEAGFHRSIDAEWELWRITGLTHAFAEDSRLAQPTSALICDLDFAIGYRSGPNLYWDNNDGQNYVIDANAGSYLTVPVHLEAAYLYPIADSDEMSLSGGIFLQNLGPEKRVEVIYSTDGWRSQSTVEANYQYRYYYGYSTTESPNQYGVEYWSFHTKLPHAEALELAVAYRVNDKIYWDSNLATNYFLQLRHD